MPSYNYLRRYLVENNLPKANGIDDNEDVSTSQLINDGIVFSTAAILIISLLILVGMFVARSCSKPTKSSNNSLSDIRNLTSRNLKENTEKIEAMKKKKKLKKKKGSKGGSVYSESQSAGESESSASASASSYQKPTEKTHLIPVETPTTREAATKLREFWQESDKINRDYISTSMRSTFTRVMSDGMTLTLHSQKGPKSIHMILNGNEIYWKTSKIFAKKQYKLNLKDIIEVKLGKTTPNFSLPTSASAHEDTCFSLITDKLTVDLQLSSKVERDAVAQGFASYVNEFKQGV